MNTLTKEDLMTIVPAAFAVGPALDRVSDRYSFISTENIIDACVERGWYPTEARQSRKVADTRHATHMITFRQPDPTVKVEGAAPQITMINNHMAMKRAKLLAGFFKFMCSNGIVVGTGIAETRQTKVHIDDAALEFELAFQQALNGIDTAVHTIQRWASTPLNRTQEIEFANACVLMKEHDVPFWASENDSRVYLERRRKEDFNHDLWTVFNVIQENMLQGGVSPKGRETRGITNVNEIERINVGLWNVAERFCNSLN
jgi:hypothetical protein